LGFEPGDNELFGELRQMFAHIGLDREHFGAADWNPLGEWIRPGMSVVVKPNLVKHEIGPLIGENVVFTHPSLIRVVVDYCLIALRGNGRVYVADAPLQGADLKRIMLAGLGALEDHYRRNNQPVSFLDLRMQWAEIDDGSGYVKQFHRLPGDPQGYSIIDLKDESRFSSLQPSGRQFAVGDYDSDSTHSHHSGGQHSYCISNTVLNADVLINVPKLKTHIKTGITCALKNFIGVNCSKDYLPHYRLGSPRLGGDEYPDGSMLARAIGFARPILQNRVPLWVWKLARLTVRKHIVKDGRNGRGGVILGGGWHGNDTLWRTIHDLVNVATHLGVDGVRRSSPRPILTIVDAVVAGEGSGPLRPSAKTCNLLMFGSDVGIIDAVCATMMGFDWRSIPLLEHLLDREARQISAFDGVVSVQTADSALEESILNGEAAFQPPNGWIGSIERAFEPHL
jgi:uncharacterized protein (DUF362 family)